MSTLELISLGIVSCLVAFDIWSSIRPGSAWHDRRDTRANLFIAFTNLIIRQALWYGAFFAASSFALELSPFRASPARVLDWAALLVLVDLVAYFRHLLQHKVRILWCVHVVHHSSLKFNHTTDLRSSVLADWGRLPTLMIMPLLGFSAEMVLITLAVYKTYDTFNHNQWVRRLGFLERCIVTPSLHRVHHGCNPAYIDRNFSTFFIVWDHFFGTFATESESVVFGTVTPLKSNRWLDVQFGEFLSLWRDVRSAASIRDALSFIFMPPGWQPDEARAEMTFPKRKVQEDAHRQA